MKHHGNQHNQHNQPMQVQMNIPLNDPAVMAMSIPQSNQAQTTGPISTEEQKYLLGERLYPLVQKAQPQLVGKITGMILDSSQVDEILSLIENPEALNEKVNEAVKVLKDYNDKQQTTSTTESK